MTFLNFALKIFFQIKSKTPVQFYSHRSQTPQNKTSILTNQTQISSRTQLKNKSTVRLPKIKNKMLPVLGGGNKLNNELNELFDNASQLFYDDPFIKGKINTLIQNIADIQNVLQMKKKDRDIHSAKVNERCTSKLLQLQLNDKNKFMKMRTNQNINVLKKLFFQIQLCKRILFRRLNMVAI
jgi:hypothetical protein